MMADTGSFDLRAFLLTGPIRWLVAGGVFLIAAIAIGTTVMVGNFRERALRSNERELENTVLLVARHFDQQLEDFTVVLKDIASLIYSQRMTAETFKERLATQASHDMLKTKIGAYSDLAGVNVFDADGQLINSSDIWPIPNVNIADRAYFRTFKAGIETSPIFVEMVRARVATVGWATIVAHKLTGPNGELIGAVTRAIPPSAYEKYFASVVLREGAAISMYLRDGTLLARHPHIERMIDPMSTQAPFTDTFHRKSAAARSA
jgi:hypothetical protein